MTNRLALITGVMGTLAVFLLTVLGGANFPNYSHASQFISELGAFGAPNARVVNLAGFMPAGLLIGAFTFFAWRSLPRSIATTLGMLGLALFAMGYLAAAVFPCEPGCRPTQPSLSQAMHNLLGLAGYLTAPLSLFVLGWEARRWPRALHLSALGFIGGGLALLGLLFLSPDFQYVGVAQRVLEGSVLAWIVVCALYVNGLSSTMQVRTLLLLLFLPALLFEIGCNGREATARLSNRIALRPRAQGRVADTGKIVRFETGNRIADTGEIGRPETGSGLPFGHELRAEWRRRFVLRNLPDARAMLVYVRRCSCSA